MRKFFFPSRLLSHLALAAFCIAVGSGDSRAQNPNWMRSSVGPAGPADIFTLAPDPYTNWRSQREDGDDFLPPLQGPGPVVSHPDYPYVPNATGDDAASNPTYRVADLTNPILTPWAIDEMRYWNDMTLEGEIIPFEAQERCFPPGVPSWHVFRRVGGTMIYFVQEEDQVTIIWRGDNQVRRVYLNVPHSANPKRSWNGESVGHYEGNTLVVDTIALSVHPVHFIDNYRNPHTDQLHVVERFEMTDSNTLDISVYVEDPGAFTMPFSMRQILYRSHTNEPIEENVCAELGLTPGADYFGLQAVAIPQTEVPDF